MTTGLDWLRAGQTASQRLSALVGSRLCHDLISPLGAIGNGVELLQISGQFGGIASSPELQLISESVEAARSRISWFRVAFGHAAADQRFAASALADLLKGADRSGRIRIHLDAGGDLPRTEVRLILLALMCLETALPSGWPRAGLPGRHRLAAGGRGRTRRGRSRPVVAA
ncbi:histidine phosphotransferase family protein [Paracoccus sp. DMF-8]|uniref:histidine phosphotransferase family protein n=1 Tax=Paracoccus sp. DMF-8 TaxID=3019445 RepID=UPI0023E7C1A1|nr:histidine phosphotransferase family protein [Paracoccus sp. DMF-8]MDF3605620.1 histidine phosphotransferase family protein [Paracoccus sp. DMF-8]